MEKERRYWIYALYDPRVPDVIRYVGYSNNPDRRLRAHIREALKSATNTYKLQWLRSLLADGVTPWWTSLESFVGTKKKAGEREQVHIAACKATGCHKLTNLTDGGDGSIGWSDEQREALRVRIAAYWATADAREQQRLAMKAFWQSDEAAWLRRKNREVALAQQADPEYQGGFRSAIARQKIRLAKLGKPHARPRTAEWNAKIRASNIGKKHSPMTEEQKENHRRALSSEETRAKMSASAKARWAKKR